MINLLVIGNASARGARNMELRILYRREDYYKGRVNLEHRSGNIPTADKLTMSKNIESLLQYYWNTTMTIG